MLFSTNEVLNLKNKSIIIITDSIDLKILQHRKANIVVLTINRQNNIKSHCVILFLHSDFPYSYTFSWVGAVQTTSPAPRCPRNNSVSTRFFGRQAVCGRALRMTSFFLKGAAPPSPLHSEY